MIRKSLPLLALLPLSAPAGAQSREKTDPTTLVVDYVGGGRYTSWWLRREGAAR